MPRKSHVRPKRFTPCRHRGFGSFCHRCALVQAPPTPVVQPSQNEVFSQKRSEKSEWNERFAADPINLRGFPKEVVVKTRSIIEALESGTPYYQLRGKRLEGNRTTISIDVKRRYRLLCRDVGSQVIPTRLLSHESYNRRSNQIA